MNANPLNDATVPLARLIAELQQPGAFDPEVSAVSVRQTHISVVFLAGDLAYKVKKPVVFDFIDYGTLEKRRLLCEEEVRLNRRLCKELYLGVVPITEGAQGLRFGGTGLAVEYAVKMRRLPEERMMEEMVRSGALAEDQVRALARHIAAFHRDAQSSPEVSAFGALEALRRNWEENFHEAAPFVGRTLTAAQDGLLRATVAAWLVRHKDRLEERVRQGRIRDVHGDLRISSVCLTEPIQVFDCLEFSPRYRCCDVASEVAFLAMDLELNGRPGFAAQFIDDYLLASPDTGLSTLLPFYGCYRAYVRGKVESLRSAEPEVGKAGQSAARDAAARCFGLACAYAQRDRPPLLLVVCGLSGTGKSALAGELAVEHGWPVISSDKVRKQLVGLSPQEHRPASFGRGIYSEPVTHHTYDEMVREASAELTAGRSVILDGTFLRRWEREAVQRLAASQGAIALFVELQARDDTIRTRLSIRENSAGSVSDADWKTYLQQREHQEPPLELSRWQHVRLQVDGPLRECRDQVLEAMRERLEPKGQPLAGMSL